MGISLDRKLSIAGYRPAVFKSALRGFLRTRSPAALVDLRSVFPLRRDGAIVFEECLDRGLIRAETLEVTMEGESLARSKVTSRTPLSKARAVLDEFLARIEALNGDPEAVRQIDQVWLFGSLMRGQADVGDIDLAVTSSRAAGFAKDHPKRERHIDELLFRIHDAPAHWAYAWLKEDWITNRALYGPRRHPLLAGVQDGTTDLESLAVPCQLIYDRKKGGRVSDPVLPRHPLSKGRQSDLDPPAELPDLTPASIRPMDGRWVAAFSSSGDVSPYDIFRGWTDDAHLVFPRYPQGLRVLGHDHDLRHYPWTPKSLGQADLDGRGRVALVNATEWTGTSFILHRRIEAEETAWNLRARFSDLELHRARKRVDAGTLPDIAAAAALIIAVDGERMLRRAREVSATPQINIILDDSGLSDEIVSGLIAPLRHFLEARLIRIEPSDWAGEPAVVQLLTPRTGPRCR